ncbi:MAG: hypothetical protein M3381_14945 [Actinomycetota bacterium]|nr:hypothetical protein [Actinomycetota bacterium]
MTRHMTSLDRRSRRRMRLAPLGVGCVLTSAVLAGCGSILEGDPGADGGNGAPRSGSYEYPTGSQDVVVSVDHAGRSVPPEYALRNTAEFLLLGDGTVIFPGAVNEPYPGVAIFPLQTTTFTEDQIQALLAAADEAGLLGEPIDYGKPGISDQATTYVDITVDGRTVSHSVYALDSEGDNEANLSAASRAARAALRDFLATHSQDSGNGPFYQPDAVLAYRLPTSTEPPAAPENEQEPRTWPIATVPPPVAEGSPHSCVAVTGQEAADLLGALAEANELTPWLIGTEVPARLAFRPLLPGDPGCEE